MTTECRFDGKNWRVDGMTVAEISAKAQVNPLESWNSLEQSVRDHILFEIGREIEGLRETFMEAIRSPFYLAELAERQIRQIDCYSAAGVLLGGELKTNKEDREALGEPALLSWSLFTSEQHGFVGEFLQSRVTAYRKAAKMHELTENPACKAYGARMYAIFTGYLIAAVVLDLDAGLF